MSVSHNGERANGFNGECEFRRNIKYWKVQQISNVWNGSVWFIFHSKAPIFSLIPSSKQSGDP